MRVDCVHDHSGKSPPPHPRSPFRRYTRKRENNVTHTVAIRAGHTLVNHGPYRYIRHPLYAAGFLAFLGFSLAAANLFILLALVGVFLVLDRRSDLEEARLIERFGQEYVNYMKVTGRYLP